MASMKKSGLGAGGGQTPPEGIKNGSGAGGGQSPKKVESRALTKVSRAALRKLGVGVAEVSRAHIRERAQAERTVRAQVHLSKARPPAGTSPQTNLAQVGSTLLALAKKKK